MNPQRAVAALAALAVGFGVTLIGANLVDDATDTAIPAESTDLVSSSGEDGAGLDDEPERNDTVAEPLSGAEVVVERDVPAATSGGATPPRDRGDTTGVDDSENGRDERQSNDVFPCSSDALDGLFDELGVLEETELISDADIFIRVLAKRLASFGTASSSEWEGELELRFDGFVPIDACPDDVDDAFADRARTGFFCAAVKLSDDARLFEYLDEVVADRMTECSYAQEEGVN